MTSNQVRIRALGVALMAANGFGAWHIHEMDADAGRSTQHQQDRYEDLQQHCFDRQLDDIRPARTK